MGGGAAFGGGGHFVGAARVRHIGNLHGYEEDWVAKTKKTIEDELRFRGIAPEVIAEITHKIEEPSCVPAIAIAVLLTALILTLVFVAIWEGTP